MLQKLSLFSLALITSFMLHNQLSAMETGNIEESIQKKLLILDAAILKTAKDLKLAKIQMDKDKSAYKKYKKDYHDEWAKSWFFGPMYNYNAPEIRAYKREYNDDSSKSKYLNLYATLTTRQNIYKKFKDEFKRGKRLNDIDYLQDIEKDIQDYLDTISQDEKETVIKFTVSTDK